MREQQIETYEHRSGSYDPSTGWHGSDETAAEQFRDAATGRFRDGWRVVSMAAIERDLVVVWERSSAPAATTRVGEER
jgi:hypothetical protein